jgi:hypothetical protein
MSATHDTHNDEPFDSVAERKACLAIIRHYVPHADTTIAALWPLYFLQRMSACDAPWWDYRVPTESRWANIQYHARREGLPDCTPMVCKA